MSATNKDFESSDAFERQCKKAFSEAVHGEGCYIPGTEIRARLVIAELMRQCAQSKAYRSTIAKRLSFAAGHLENGMPITKRLRDRIGRDAWLSIEVVFMDFCRTCFGSNAGGAR